MLKDHIPTFGPIYFMHHHGVLACMTLYLLGFSSSSLLRFLLLLYIYCIIVWQKVESIMVEFDWCIKRQVLSNETVPTQLVFCFLVCILLTTQCIFFFSSFGLLSLDSNLGSHSLCLYSKVNTDLFSFIFLFLYFTLQYIFTSSSSHSNIPFF